MSIRVGTRRYQGKGFVDPEYKGFTKIICLTRSTPYGALGPYVLEQEGMIFENIYQFSRLYESVPKSVQRSSRFDSTIIWDHPAEVHVKDGKITEEYWAWREKGMHAKHAVRYPVGYKHNGKNILGLLHYDPEGKSTAPAAEKLSLPEGWVLHDYINARKQVYFPLYRKLARKQAKFLALKKRLAKGENLLIIEVDGPIQADLPYYKEKYGVEDDFIENHTMLVTQAHLDIMVNDPKRRAGHGYALAAELLDLHTS